MEDALKVSIVMPCLNEVNTLAICIKKANDFFQKNGIVGEIIIADNGSTDGSVDIAKQNEVTLINVEKKGHGHAVSAGIENAKGIYIIMGDSDNSYDFSDLLLFITKLENEGFDMVIGNRFEGGIEKGAMPFLHRYLGVPFLSYLNRLFYKNAIHDIHGGLRAFKKEMFEKLSIDGRDMTYCTEMIIKASLNNLKLTEIPIKLSSTFKGRKPHLHTWKDGWRCLKCTIKFRKERKNDTIS